MANKNNGVKMSPDEIRAFYQAIGEVCNRFNIQGVSGVWFGEGEEWGKMIFWAATETRMKVVVQALADKFEEFQREIGAGNCEQIGYINEATARNGEQN